MKYDEKNRRYEVGMGLYFSLTNKHIYYLEEWVSRSNIPDLELRKLDAKNEADAIIEVTGIIQRGLNFLKE